MTGPAAEDLDDEEVLDSLTIGRRIRQLRTDRGMTLDDLATVLDRAPSQVSVIENGKRELKLGELQRLARALDTTLDDLLSPEPPSRRAALEIALERAQRGPLYASLGLPPLPVRKSLSDEAIEIFERAISQAPPVGHTPHFAPSTGPVARQMSVL